MALVWAGQCFIIEGYEEVKRKTRFGNNTKNVREPILWLTGIQKK